MKWVCDIHGTTTEELILIPGQGVAPNCEECFGVELIDDEVEEEYTNYYMGRHRPQSRDYHCTGCRESFYTWSDLDSHRKKMHSAETIVCNEGPCTEIGVEDCRNCKKTFCKDHMYTLTGGNVLCFDCAAEGAAIIPH